MSLITLYESHIYIVKKNCNIKLEGITQNSTGDIILNEREQFQVEPYTGYDIYGEDYVVYNGGRYLLRWDKKVLECLIESIDLLM